MVYISETIINEVREAKNDQEIRQIIDKCVLGLKGKNGSGRIDKKYTRNILMALKYYKSKEIEASALENVTAAIDIVKNLHAQGTENLW